METALFIYIYTVLGSIVSLIVVFLVLISVASSAVGLLWVVTAGHKDDNQQVEELIKKTYKPLLMFAIPSLILVAAYPTKEDLKFIIGGAIAYEGGSALINTDGAQKLPENLVNAANAFLESIAEKDEEK